MQLPQHAHKHIHPLLLSLSPFRLLLFSLLRLFRCDDRSCLISRCDSIPFRPDLWLGNSPIPEQCFTIHLPRVDSAEVLVRYRIRELRCDLLLPLLSGRLARGERIDDPREGLGVRGALTTHERIGAVAFLVAAYLLLVFRTAVVIVGEIQRTLASVLIVCHAGRASCSRGIKVEDGSRSILQ